VLIAAKANVVLKDSYDMTALHRAAVSGKTSMCRMLIDEGALLTAMDFRGQTPLELAIKRGNTTCVAILEAEAAEALAAAYAFVDEHIATTRGFGFAVTKAADEQAPLYVKKHIFNAAEQGKLDKLLGLCQEWAGHEVIDAFDNEV